MRKGFQPAPEDIERLAETLNQLLYGAIQRLLSQMPKGFPFPGLCAEDSPYRVLGLDPSAPDDLVKLAYKWLAQRCHPDRGGSDQAMARLNQAYDQIARERKWRTK